MAEKYSNFESPTTDNTSVLTDIKFGKDWNIKVRELALGGCLLIAIIVCVVLAAVLVGKKEIPPKSSPNIYEQICVSGPCLKSASYVTQNMNKSVDPCTNFYKYACGGYPKIFPLNTQSNSRTLYTTLYDENRDKIDNILSAPLQRGEESSAERKLKHLFQSCTDTYKRDTLKGTPILTKILPDIGGWYVTGTLNAAQWNFKDALKKAVVDYWTHAFFTVYIMTDWNDSTKKVVELHMSGTTMYWYYYVSEDAAKYRSDLRQMMMTLGTYMLRDSNVTLDEATKTERLNTFVNDAFYIESILANITINTYPSSNPHAEENRETLSAFDARTGNAIDFTSILTNLFAEAGLTANSKVVLYHEEYLVQMTHLVGSLGANSARILNNYLVWKIISRYVQELSGDYNHASRNFYVDLFGRESFQGLQRYCFNTLASYLGDALSSLYVRDHFSDSNKHKAEEIIQYVKDALASTTEDNIFDAETRAIAKEKLSASLDKLGYPDFMLDDSKVDSIYASLQVDKDDYFSNLLSINNFVRIDWNNFLTNGDDRNVWFYKTYDTVIAYHSSWNELTVPAGLLQFPFYDHTLPHFMNFGTLGSIVGHYLVYGIDELGGNYQKDGTVDNWWSNFTKKRWDDAKTCVSDYYSTRTMGPFTVPGDPDPVTVPVNGKYYGVEGIAHASGVKVAYRGYTEWIKKNREEKLAPGLDLTNEQMFFVAFAQVMCYNRKDNTAYDYAVRGIISEDIITNSVLSQLPEFVEAFNCPVKSPMNADKKCSYF